MYKIIAFVVFSAGIVYISRGSLKTPRSHGFYRFFAWELILALFLLNVEYWLVDPFSWHQCIAWVLLFGSLVPLYFGVRALAKRGKALDSRQEESELYAFERTTKLVTTGIYRFVRHPLYASLLYVAWGIAFKHPTWMALLLVAVTTAFLLATARADERECIRFFGAEYEAYMKRSKRFVPFLW